MLEQAAIQNEVYLLSIQKEIYNRIQLNAHKLSLIREKSGSLIEKWQDLLQFLLPIQRDVLQADDQSALSKFNEEFSRCLARSPALHALNVQKWLFIFEHAFGMTEFKEITLQEAQNLITEIAKEMTSEPFLVQIDHAIELLPPDASLIDKRQAILTILLPLHMSVMARHGFEGEMGYIQAQRAIMDYYHDPIIAQSAAHAQSIVFKRAGLS